MMVRKVILDEWVRDLTLALRNPCGDRVVLPLSTLVSMQDAFAGTALFPILGPGTKSLPFDEAEKVRRLLRDEFWRDDAEPGRRYSPMEYVTC